MSSKGDIFDRIAEKTSQSSEDVFDRIASKKEKKPEEKKSDWRDRKIDTFLKKEPPGPPKIGPGAAAGAAGIGAVFDALQGASALADPTQLAISHGMGREGPSGIGDVAFQKFLELIPPESREKASTFRTLGGLLSAAFGGEGIAAAKAPEAVAGLRGAQEAGTVLKGAHPLPAGAPAIKPPPSAGPPPPPGAPPPPPRQPPPPPGSVQAQFPDVRFESEFEVGKHLAEVPERKLPLPETEAAAKSLRNRVTQGGEDVKLRPPRGPESVENRVGDVVSTKMFRNDTQGGQALKNEIMRLDERDYRNVNDLYRRSRELHRNIEAPHPELIESLTARLQELQGLPEPSGPQKQLIQSLQNMIRQWSVVDEAGHAQGFRPINNQLLIDQIQSLRQKLDLDFAHGDASNIFLPTINDLHDAVEAASRNNPEALNAIENARASYADWSQRYNNPYIRPFRDARNQDFAKLFRGALDVDELNMIRNVLRGSRRGQQLDRATLRSLVLQKLKPFIEGGTKISQKEFDKTLRELEAVASPREINQIRHRFSAMKKAESFKKPVKELPKNPLIDKDYEQISKMADSLSGIDKLEKTIGKTTQGRKVLNDVLEHKGIDRIYNGKVKAPENSKFLKELLNNKEDLAYLKKTLGSERIEDLRRVVNHLEEIEKNLSKIAEAQPENEKVIGMLKFARKIIEFTSARNLLKKGVTEVIKILEKGQLKELGDYAKKFTSHS